MANPIRRVIQLVLDKAAAAKAASDAKTALSGMETGFSKLKSAALKLGSALAAAFGVRALINFGKASVKAAAEAEKVWVNLKGTIDATGESFDSLEGSIRAAAAAMQDSTTHDGEDYAEGLARMVTLTGDVSASIANMGLAANVAAQFFKDDLAAGVELVAKVSTGTLTPLGRMGIHVKSAAEGLQVLAERSLNAAERQTRTFDGQLKVLNNTWGDFKEELGGALIAGGNTTNVLQLLGGAVKSMTAWVVENKDEIARWASTGIQAAISAMRTLLGLMQTYFQARGQMSLTAGSRGPVLADTEKGLNAQLAMMRKQRTQLEAEQAKTLAALEKKDSGLDLLKQFLGGPVASTKAMAGKSALALELQSINDELVQVEDNARAAETKLAELKNPTAPGSGLFGGAPVVVNEVAGAAGEAAKVKELVDPVGESFKTLTEAMDVAQGMSQLLGREFDLTGAQVSALTDHVQDLLAEGFSPMDPYLVAVTARLRGLLDAHQDVAAQLALDLDVIAVQASAFADTEDPFGSVMATLESQASALESAITSLAVAGFDASDPAMQKYIQQLDRVRGAMRAAQDQADDYGIAVANVQALIVGAIGGSLKEVAKAKAKENLLLAAEQAAHGLVSLLNPITAATAPGHFASAAKFGAIATAWAALGAGLGGGGGAAGGGGGGAGRGSALGASGAASQAAKEPGQEIHIHLVGPGFDALNPEVQRVVYGAQQQARERYGENARVNIVRRH